MTSSIELWLPKFSKKLRRHHRSCQFLIVSLVGSDILFGTIELRNLSSKPAFFTRIDCWTLNCDILLLQSTILTFRMWLSVKGTRLFLIVCPWLSQVRYSKDHKNWSDKYYDSCCVCVSTFISSERSVHGSTWMTWWKCPGKLMLFDPTWTLDAGISFVFAS